MGKTEFSYLLLPFSGDVSAPSATRAAAQLNTPPFCLLETYHNGPLPLSAGCFSCDAENIVLTAWKPAYDGEEGSILRMCETGGRKAIANISLGNIRFMAKFHPFEIKTYRVGDKVVPINLLEHPLEESHAAL